MVDRVGSIRSAPTAAVSSTEALTDVPSPAPASRGAVAAPPLAVRVADPHPNAFANAFVGWSVKPTGIGALDFVIDLLGKLVISPLLLLAGFIDAVFGAGIIDGIAGSIQLAILRSSGLDYLRHKSAHDADQIIARMVRRGELGPLLAEMDEAHANELFALTLSKVRNPETLAFLIDALRDTERHDAVTRVVYRAAALGNLNDVMAYLRHLRPEDTDLESLPELARDLPLPLVIAHRGLPTAFPENTMASVRAAMDQGADGVEIDLSITADGHIVMWHDAEPGGMVALMRQSGLEPGMGFHPVVPPLGSAMRRPVAELTLSELRATHGYQRNDATGVASTARLPFEIPTFEQFAAWAAGVARMKKVALDIKLPEDAPVELIERFGRTLADALDRHGLRERSFLMTPYPRVLNELRRVMGERFDYSLDVEIVSLAPDPSDVTGIDDGVRMGNRTTSIGRPRLGIDNYDVFLEVLNREWSRVGRPHTVAWTLNEERELRDVIGTGIPGAILTDNPARLRALVDELRLATRPPRGERRPAARAAATARPPR